MKTTLFKGLFAVSAATVITFSSAFAGQANMDSSKAVVEAEPEQWWNAELAAGWDSKYIFRGVNIFASGDNGSLVWTDLSFSTHGFTLGAWFAEGVRDDYNELNIYASYGYALGPVSVEGGYIYYLFPKAGDTDTHELFVSLSTEVIPHVTPTLSYYHDVDLFEGGYLEFALSTSIPVVADVISIDPFAAISYDFEYNSTGNDFNHVEAGVEVPIALSENITLAGYIKHSWALEAIDSFQGDEWVGGASISFSF